MPAPTVVSAAKKMPGRRKVAGQSQPATKSDKKTIEKPAEPAADGVLATTAEERALLPMYQRDNAEVLGGEALRNLAYEVGIPLSTLADEPDDDRVRMEIRLIQQRRFEEQEE